ncbi:peroxidase-like isoform X2 [Penaeus chinensis]|uniref:peroxidase-like isoform X2 n=1 Tax=Penaeus chinensis TaxID=139456 RepID=UPI001FB77A53|nr:peroxidase-like isoform X2 [Penaeus chinensis]
MKVLVISVAAACILAVAKGGSAGSLEDLDLPLKDKIWYENNNNAKRPEASGSYPAGDTYNWDRKPALEPLLTAELERESLEYAREILKKLSELLEKIKELALGLPPGSAAYMHQNNFKKSHPFSANVSKQSYFFNAATAYLAQKLNLDPEYVTFDLTFQSNLIKTDEFCDKDMIREEPTDCKAFKHYRSIDGTCNNLAFPTWGSTFTSLRRVTPPFYSDGVKAFRLAKNGEELPSARLVSSSVNLKRNVESPSISVLYMTFGQFLDHDLDFSPLHKNADGKDIPCCPDMLQGDDSVKHPECAPIAIPANDPFYAQFNQTCMEFVRSVGDSSCVWGPREQLNEKTSYLDGSAVYGFEQTLVDSLREFKDGLLKFQVTKEGEELVPANTDMTNACNKQEKADIGQFCFRAGDRRINEQPLLVLLHVVWSRYHNYLAKGLKGLNPHWDDEKLFQEARRILSALLQHVTYNEYVSVIFGKKLSNKFNFLPLKGKARTNIYDETLSAAISDVFAGAAFRFGHSQISGSMERMDKTGDVTCTEMSSVFMNPFVVYTKGAVTELIRGEVAQNAAEVDPFFTPQVTGKLFRGDMPFGMDLAAINIQRGRDHGLAPYNRVRMACGFPLITKFKQLIRVMDKGAVKSLKKVYKHVDDIDLFVGGLAETPIKGGLVGPTFACVLADQFLRLKIGDRYWYETNDPDTRFETAQLKAIRKTTLASIMCSVIPELKEIQLWPFRLASRRNPMVPCSSFKKMNLKPWKE